MKSLTVWRIFDVESHYRLAIIFQHHSPCQARRVPLYLGYTGMLRNKTKYIRLCLSFYKVYRECWKSDVWVLSDCSLAETPWAPVRAKKESSLEPNLGSTVFKGHKLRVWPGWCPHVQCPVCPQSWLSIWGKQKIWKIDTHRQYQRMSESKSKLFVACFEYIHLSFWL